MTALMLPPVADEPAPKSALQIALTILALVVILAVAFRLARAPEFDEAQVVLEIPATAETLARGLALYRDRKPVYRDRKSVDAYRLLRPHADQGHPEAQRVLGWIYGLGFDGAYAVDHCKAAVWLDRAARAGHPLAMARLGEYYVRGVGVPRDPVKGFLWVRQARREFPRHPDIPPSQAKQMMEYVKRAMTYDYRSALDDDARAPAGVPQDWTFTQEPPAVLAPLPDIPIVDLFVMAISGTRQGCHAAPMVSPSDWWVNEMWLD